MENSIAPGLVVTEVSAVKRVFARIQQGLVVGLIPERDDICNEWHADVVATLVEVTTISPAVQVGWVLGENGVFEPAPSPVLTRQQRFEQAVIGAGCTITSTGTPVLSATYDAFGARWQQMMGELQYIAGFGAFSGGLTELDWPARSGEVVFSTVDQFKAVVRAVADWLTAWQRFVDGKVEVPPTLPVTIA